MLRLHQGCQARLRKIQQIIELAAAEGGSFRCSLNLQQATIASLHNIQVHLGSAVFAVVQIQQGLASIKPTDTAAT